MAEKKKRGQNFTMEEKDRLIKLLAQYRSTILNKKTDGTTNMAKMQAWNALTNKFNSCGSTYRTKDSLVKQWDKLKTEAKIYNGKNKKGVMGTGGGPSTVKSDPVLDQACDLLGRACSGMLAVNDSDADIPTSGALESSMFHDIATEVEIYEREGEQDVPMENMTVQDVAPGPSCLVEFQSTPANMNIPDAVPGPSGVTQQMPLTDIPDQENTTTGQPLWSRRRRPQMGARHERTEALENITSSFCNVQQQKLTYEQLKVQLLMDEKIFKDSLYKIQLTTAEKELEIKVEILKQIQRGGLSLENIMGKKKDE
ncbi:unnamed protein product [Plutella xylostella]|uniref:Regulatory protein zeste n=2 Tax=Plutella xylostella TaxID=51655 RepID=A0A8S4DBM7_PLUXY|nr:unnamed protein product [Plutella xylostella]